MLTLALPTMNVNLSSALCLLRFGNERPEAACARLVAGLDEGQKVELWNGER
jgi:hypothetical protein